MLAEPKRATQEKHREQDDRDDEAALGRDLDGVITGEVDRAANMHGALRCRGGRRSGRKMPACAPICCDAGHRALLLADAVQGGHWIEFHQTGGRRRRARPNPATPTPSRPREAGSGTGVVGVTVTVVMEASVSVDACPEMPPVVT